MSTGARKMHSSTGDVSSEPTGRADCVDVPTVARRAGGRRSSTWSHATRWPGADHGVAARRVKRIDRCASAPSGTSHGSATVAARSGATSGISSGPDSTTSPSTSNSQRGRETGEVAERLAVLDPQRALRPTFVTGDRPIDPRDLLHRRMRHEVGRHQPVGDEVAVVRLLAELPAVREAASCRREPVRMPWSFHSQMNPPCRPGVDVITSQ